jgi:hypothetical protein
VFRPAVIASARVPRTLFGAENNNGAPALRIYRKSLRLAMFIAHALDFRRKSEAENATGFWIAVENVTRDAVDDDLISHDDLYWCTCVASEREIKRGIFFFAQTRLSRSLRVGVIPDRLPRYFSTTKNPRGRVPRYRSPKGLRAPWYKFSVGLQWYFFFFFF